jgi:hypothetical protein
MQQRSWSPPFRLAPFSAKYHFALKANLLESRRSGAPMVHPMPGPVTLHWRS